MWLGDGELVIGAALLDDKEKREDTRVLINGQGAWDKSLLCLDVRLGRGTSSIR